MAAIFGSISVLCLIYYGIIIIYSGIRTSFSAIWIILAVCMAVMAAASHFYLRVRDRVPLRAVVSVVTVVITLFLIFLFVEAAIAINFVSFGNQSVDYVIVLGAQVRGDELSKSLKYRLDKALEYAEVHPNTTFILSGGQGPGENMTEARMMYEYMKAGGVPESQMILEERSTSTYENMVYSKMLIDIKEAGRRVVLQELLKESGYQQTAGEGHNIHVGIVTNNFHMMRAKGIAKKIGIQAPYGISAKSDPVLFVHFCVRECFAIIKDKIVGNM